MPERRAQLLEVGLRAFSVEPYDGLSTERLAALAGTSKGLLFHYFGSKRGFYLATIEEVARRLLEASAPPEGVSFDEALRASLAGFVAFVADEGALCRAMLRGGVGSDAESQAVAERVRRARVERVLAHLGVGEPRPPLRVMLYGWVGMCEAATFDWEARRDLEQGELVELLARGIEPALRATSERTQRG